jgi:tetratricopeptide (TPR) repeat protein
MKTITLYWLLSLLLGRMPIPAGNYYNAGNRLYQQGQYARAEVLYQKAFNADLVTEQAYYNAGNAAFMQRKYSAAIKYYEAALDRNPEDQDAWHNLEAARSRLPEAKTLAPALTSAPKASSAPDSDPMQDLFNKSPEDILEMMRAMNQGGYPYRPGSSLEKKTIPQSDEIDW